MLKLRSYTIKVFEYTILVGIILGCLSALVSGVGMMISPWGSFFMGLFVSISGVVASFAAGGAAFLLVGIYENTKKAI
jgi:ABC-type nitrate/sulfonate/bicarbonate transport system permease component